MYLLGLGIILLLLKWQAVWIFADLAWWWVLAPFVGTVLWWAWADASGYTKRKAMERDDERKLERINRQRKALGQKVPPGGASSRRR